MPGGLEHLPHKNHEQWLAKAHNEQQGYESATGLQHTGRETAGRHWAVATEKHTLKTGVVANPANCPQA